MPVILTLTASPVKGEPSALSHSHCQCSLKMHEKGTSAMFFHSLASSELDIVPNSSQSFSGGGALSNHHVQSLPLKKY